MGEGGLELGLTGGLHRICVAHLPGGIFDAFLQAFAAEGRAMLCCIVSCRVECSAHSFVLSI